MALTPANKPLWMPADTGGLIIEADAGATVDNVSVYASSESSTGKVSRVFVDGAGNYNTSWAGMFGSGDKTVRLQTIGALSGLKNIIVDSQFTINGDVVLSPSVTISFQNGGKISGTGSIRYGTIQAAFEDHIFDPGFTFTDMRCANGAFSLKWYGAVGDGSADDYAACQAAIDACLNNKGWGVLMCPTGIYQCSKGLLWYQDRTGDGQADGISFAMIGQGAGYNNGSSEGGETTFRFTDPQDFGIAVQRGKGCLFMGMTIFGQNFAGYSITTLNVGKDDTVFVTPGVRDQTTSPSAGIVIDPFGDHTMSTESRYPNWTSYYTQESIAGSTDIKIINCSFKQWVVGICNSPNGHTQNAECMVFQNIWSDYNKVAISNGQAQAKEIICQNIKCWGGTEVVFECRRYGNGTGAAMMVDGANIAGAVKWLCSGARFGSSQNNIFNRVFAESMYGLGGDLDGTNRCSISIQNSEIDLIGQLPGYWDRPKTIVCCDTLQLSNVNISNLSAGDPTPYLVNCNFIELNNCNDIYFINNNMRDSSVTYNGTIGAIKGKSVVTINTTNAVGPIYLQSGMQIQYNLGGQVVSTYYGSRNHRIVISNAWTTVSVDTSTAKAIMQVNAGDFYKCCPYAYVISTAVDEFGINKSYVVGRITNIFPLTNRVEISYLTSECTDTSFTVPVPVLMQEVIIPTQFFLLGDATSGSNVITNAEGEYGITPATNSGTAVFQYMDSPYFPVGTYISAVTSTTITLSANALYSENGIFVNQNFSWRKQGFSGKIQTLDSSGFNYSQIFKRGDVVYPSALDTTENAPTASNITGWVCTKSGKITSTNTPTFKTNTGT